MGLFKHSDGKRGNGTTAAGGVAQRYHTLGCAGKGSCSQVDICFDSLLNRTVAVKRLCGQWREDPSGVEAFANEARLLSYLDHPGVTTILDTFADSDTTPCYAMKLVEGEVLAAVSNQLLLSSALRICTRLCETLAYVHDRGIVHLNLTPDNIMVSRYGEVVITGWGYARAYDLRPWEEHHRLIRQAPKTPPAGLATARAAVSPHFSAPELVRGSIDDLGPEADVYSVGLLLYRMLAGTAPGGAPEHTGVPVPLAQLNTEVPCQLEKLCARMMAHEVFERYHSFHEILRDLDIFQHSGQAFASRTFNENEVIFREGEAGEFAFLVSHGEVAVVKLVDGRQTILARLGKDQIVGELAIFTHEPRTATVVATQPGTVIRIMGRAEVEQELRKLSPWVGRMITGLSQRFNEMNARLIALTRTAPAP